jgi:hypothetical protein
MIRNSWDKLLIEVWHSESEVGWVTLRMQNIEKTEEFAIAYAADVTHFHKSRLP